MDAERNRLGQFSTWLLVAILALAAVTRLHQLRGPLADNLQAKQIYIANKARSIARPPFDPLRNTLDFLDERGQRIALTEEVPLYTTLLAAGFRLFGERAAVGHLLSLFGSLLAIGAFHDLARREHGERPARVASLLLAMAPLFIFYGRAVLPDPWMLAGMLGCAAAYRRFLDGLGWRWLFLAAGAGLLAAAFKYFGLMVLIPLAEMTRRRSGLRGLWRAPFLVVGLAMLAPIAAWMVLVFLQGPNPVAAGWTGSAEDVRPYLILQAPGTLLDRDLWGAFFSRFLWRDCGPVTTILITVGLWAVARRRVVAGPLAAWTGMGLAFYVLLGPKLIDHDYYELMMLPAAALWGAWGWEAIRRRTSQVDALGRMAVASYDGPSPAGREENPVPLSPWERLAARWPGEGRARFLHQLIDPSVVGRVRLAWTAPALLAILIVAQSPWVLGGLFDLEREKVALGERLRRACPPDGRVVVIGPGIALATVVHYAEREGWALRGPTLPADWRSRFAAYQERGAKFVGLYFDPKADPEQRESYRPLIEALTVVDRHLGPTTKQGGRPEFLILKMGTTKLARRE